MRVTISDIAQKAKVSTATVSYVMNGRDSKSITGKTRRRVLKAAEEMGYVPNRFARSLVTGRTQIIALWGFQIHPSYYAKAIRHTSLKLRKDHYDVHLIETNDDYQPQWAGRVLASSPVDGVLAFDSPRFVEAYLKSHRHLPKPIVSVGGSWSEKTDFVGVDLFSGTVEAVEHLLGLGRSRVAYLLPRGKNRRGEPRREGYLAAMRRAKQAAELIVVDSPMYGVCRASVRAGVRDYVKANGCPGAIFCFNDEAAISAYRGLRDLSLRIPDEVAIVGCDGIEETEYFDVPLSTVALPTERMCELAWEFLQKRMAEPDAPPQRKVFKPELLVRESSGQHSRSERWKQRLQLNVETRKRRACGTDVKPDYAGA